MQVAAAPLQEAAGQVCAVACTWSCPETFDIFFSPNCFPLLSAMNAVTIGSHTPGGGGGGAGSALGNSTGTAGNGGSGGPDKLSCLVICQPLHSDTHIHNALTQRVLMALWLQHVVLAVQTTEALAALVRPPVVLDLVILQTPEMQVGTRDVGT